MNTNKFEYYLVNPEGVFTSVEVWREGMQFD